MLRLVVSMSSEAAKSYFADGLSKSDYYLSDQELPAHWHGLGAERLGLFGDVKREDFFALADNLHPTTGTFITPGGNREHRRVGYDINFHCPKSVSVLHAMGVHEGILPSFQESVEETMRDMERDMQTRIRIGGQYEDRTTGNLIWAGFTHQTARPSKNAPPDPHLHAHCYTFNMTFDSVEQRFKAGQFVGLKRDGMYYQALFHKRLADKLGELGFTIERTKDAFEVIECNPDAVKLFSKRTNHIGQIAKKEGITDPAELDALGARTRASKQKGLSMSDLRQLWKDQLKGTELIIETKSNLRKDYSVRQCKEHALKHCFERKSVATNRTIVQESLRLALGSRSVSIEDVQQSVQLDKDIVRVSHKGQTQCTTRVVLEEEREMVSLALKGMNCSKPLHAFPYTNWSNTHLSVEQKKTINHILLDRNSITLVVGRAGTGKTTMMVEAVEAIEKNGKMVFAFAPTAEASRGVLRNEGFKKANTIASLIANKALQKEVKNQVLWIDEAGLIGSRDMVKLLALADRQKCKVILTGDDRQHRSVARGDAFRLLNEVAGLPTAGTKTIYRQKKEEYREAVSNLSEGKVAEGFVKLERMGAIQELESDAIHSKLTSSYIEAIKKGKTALVISPTHKEREKIAKHIRTELQNLGLVSTTEKHYNRLQSLNFTEAEKEDPLSYKPGMVVQTQLHLTKELPIGVKATVVEIKNGHVYVLDIEGNKQRLPLDKANRFDVNARKTIAISEGDQLRLTRNTHDLKGSRLDNGQVLLVKGFTKQGEIIASTSSSGKRANFKEYLLSPYHENYDHAYCQTSYAAQGKTVDQVFIHQPVATFPATSQEQFYVSVSRGRENVTVYTDDREMLRLVASESGERLSALELNSDNVLPEKSFVDHQHDIEMPQLNGNRTKNGQDFSL